MRQLILICLFFPNFLLGQDLLTENIILSANRIDTLRFISDSVATGYYFVDADQVKNLIHYNDSTNKTLIDKIKNLFDTEAIELFLANDSNTFLGSPMTRIQFYNQLTFTKNKSVKRYCIRIQDYFRKGKPTYSRIFALAPLIEQKNIKHKLFWLPLDYLDELLNNDLYDNLLKQTNFDKVIIAQ